MVLLIPRRKTVRNETPVEGGARVPGVASFLESQVPPADVLTEMIGGEELTRCYIGKSSLFSLVNISGNDARGQRSLDLSFENSLTFSCSKRNSNLLGRSIAINRYV